MPDAKIVKQIVAETEDKVRMLAEVTQAVADAGANIEALCAYGMEGKAVFMIVTNDNKKASAGLKAKGCRVKEEDVVLIGLANRTGSASKMAKKLKEARINLSYIYGSTSGAADAPLVFASNDNAKAVTVLNKK